jgi:hypothetical protein
LWRESKPSSVSSGHLSRSIDRPAPRDAGCSRLSALASHLQAAGSEIAAGRIALFTRIGFERCGLVSVALALQERANLDCQRQSTLPRFSPGTVTLCSSDFPLERDSLQRPPFPSHLLLLRFGRITVEYGLQQGQVPKGRFARRHPAKVYRVQKPQCLSPFPARIVQNKRSCPYSDMGGP